LKQVLAMTEKKDVLRSVDADARRLAKSLLRSARFAALGSIDTTDGSPSVSRVSLATAMDGAPGFLISRLSSHFGNLEADARCSLLVGEPGKGDPLAHARMTITGRARRLDGGERDAFSRRYLMRHPKASLYAGFSDFAFWVIDLSRASLNGGFGKAYALEPGDILAASAALDKLGRLEASAIEHMNSDHKEAVDSYAKLAGVGGHGWHLACLDPDGLDLVKGDACTRLWFDTPLEDADDLRETLVSLAQRR
jgi:heme iron utilization protein